MTVAELYSKLSTMYPSSLSCDWDNDGYMCVTDRSREVGKIAVALDATVDAVNEAIRLGADVLITHHPMIFRGIKSIDTDSFAVRRAITACNAGLTVMSFHTRLDAADGGVNDALAAKLGLTNISKFGDSESPELGRIGDIVGACSVKDFARFVKDALGAPSVSYCDCGRKLARVAVVGGSGDSLITAALAAGADTFVTGDVGYNDHLDYAECGISIICAGHYFTEAPVTEILADVSARLTGAETVIINSNKIANI